MCPCCACRRGLNLNRKANTSWVLLVQSPMTVNEGNLNREREKDQTLTPGQQIQEGMAGLIRSSSPS